MDDAAAKTEGLGRARDQRFGRYTGHSDHSADEPPTFVVVGERDGIAPPSVMERRVAALRRAGAEVEFHRYRDVLLALVGKATGPARSSGSSTPLVFPPSQASPETILLAPAKPLPGHRATFYVLRSDDNPVRGRRLMYMRDLACCANGMAFYSTPSDLVRFALATNPGSVNGELAGGVVMSLVMRRDSGIVVAVTSNMAHANTSSLVRRVGDAFAEQAR